MTDHFDAYKVKFTADQISNWRRYEKVRESARFNMFDPRARDAAGLTTEEYTFCMRHYGALKDAAKEQG